MAQICAPISGGDCWLAIPPSTSSPANCRGDASKEDGHNDAGHVVGEYGVRFGLQRRKVAALCTHSDGGGASPPEPLVGEEGGDNADGEEEKRLEEVGWWAMR